MIMFHYQLKNNLICWLLGTCHLKLLNKQSFYLLLNKNKNESSTSVQKMHIFCFSSWVSVIYKWLRTCCNILKKCLKSKGNRHEQTKVPGSKGPDSKGTKLNIVCNVQKKKFFIRSRDASRNGMSQHIDTKILPCSLHIWRHQTLLGFKNFTKKEKNSILQKKQGGNVIAFDIIFLGEMEIQHRTN